MNLRNAVATGRTRFKLWRGRLVLQLEFSGTYTSWYMGAVNTETALAWRDATVEDVTTQEME